MPPQSSFDLLGYIREHDIEKPNGTKPVTKVHADDIILLEGTPCIVTKRTLKKTGDPNFPNVRLQGRGVFDDRHRETIFRNDEDYTVGSFTEDANVFNCVMIKFIEDGMLLSDIDNLGMPFEIKFSSDYLNKRVHEEHEKALAEGKEMRFKVRELWGSRKILKAKASEPESDPELPDPIRGAVLEQ